MIGKLDERQRLTVVRRLFGQVPSGPSGVVDQSIDRISLPMSPPPTSQWPIVVASLYCCSFPEEG